MKNPRAAQSLSFFIAAVFVLCVFSSKAQDSDVTGFTGFSTPKPMQGAGILKFAPTPILMGQMMFTGELRISYEHKIAKRQSITIGASYDFPNFIIAAFNPSFNYGGHHGGGAPNRFNDYSIEGGRITLGYRYYPLKKLDGLNGLFVGPYVSYNAVNIRQKYISGDYETTSFFNANAIVGYQYVSYRHFSFEVFTGFGYKKAVIFHYNQLPNEIYNVFYNNALGRSPVKFVLQINMGYAF